ncbi:MAG: hypothetical protein EOM20_08515 [Spartobacteria bacterium]|nr:hypothetical protein [Spartobacteria bacterium]
MAKKYQVMVFGKSGCPKCKVLNQRLDKCLEQPGWEDFEKNYLNLETEEGLVHFCKVECINPQRIPAFFVAKKTEEGAYKPVMAPQPGQTDPVCKKSRLHHVVGLQTDYSDAGRGVISPRMIESVLKDAASL